MNIETVLLTDQQDQEATVLSDQEPEEIVPAQQQDVMSKKNQQKEEERMALLDEQGGGEGGIRLKKKKVTVNDCSCSVCKLVKSARGVYFTIRATEFISFAVSIRNIGPIKLFSSGCFYL